MAETDPEFLARVREICLGLPETHEQKAWIGERWRIRTKTFAHVYTLDAGDESAMMPTQYFDTGLTGLTFRVLDEEIDALKHAGPPFWYSDWGRDAFGMAFDDRTDWAEVRELLTDSYRVMAPQFLVRRVADL